MACCIFTAYIMNRMIQGLEILDLNLINIQYNDFDDPEPLQEMLPSSTRTLRIRISGMTCAACATQIEDALIKLDGVDRVLVSLPLERATVIYNSDCLTPNDVEEAVQQAGYVASVGDRTIQENMELLLRSEQLQTLRSTFSSAASISGVLVAVDSIRLTLPLDSNIGYDFLLFTVTIFLAGWVQVIDARWIHQSAWGRFRKDIPVNMDTLISLCLILGILLSFFNMSLEGWRAAETYFTTGCLLSTVITAGRYLDLALKRSGSSNFTELYRLQSETALVQVFSNETYIPASMLRKNEEIVLEPMSIIPCDCYVLNGSTSVDEAIMTGESTPAKKVVGDFLISGTRNLLNRVVAIVSAEQADSSLERMIETISSATERNSDDRNQLDVITSHFVTTILILACMSFAYSLSKTSDLFVHKINTAAQRAMAVLAASCPCALGLAAPSATMAAVDAAWNRGAFLTGGKKTLDALSVATHIVMDKTGTLTEGLLQVKDCQVSQHVDKTLCQRLLYLAERDVAQSHPAGRAVFQWALQNLEDAQPNIHSGCEVIGSQSVLGNGVSCVISKTDGTLYSVHVGSKRFLHDAGISFAQSKCLEENLGLVIVHFAINGTYAGYLTLEERIRKDAPEVIRQLKAKGLEVSMLTGDTHETASRVSTALGIPVLADRSLPHEKQSWIRSLQAQGGKVVMIGDGINDSLAHAAADVGVLLSLSRTCMTGAADVVIVSPNLEALPALLDIAKMATNQAKWNIRWAIGYNAIAVSLAFGIFERWGLLVNVSLAGTLMALSSLVILLMSLQLRRRLSRI